LPYIELSNFLLKETDERFSVYDSEIDTYKLLDSNITFLQKNIASVLYEIEKNKNFKLDEKNEVAQGLITPNDNVSKDSLKILGDNFNIGDGIFNLTTEEKESLFLEDNELDLVYWMTF
jgi:hypothetical protein